jgi:hypothetical protein
MGSKRLFAALIAAAFSAATLATPNHPVPERYKDLIERAYSGENFAIEVRSGNAKSKFEVDENSVVQPSDEFLDTSEVSEWTVDDEDSGATSIRDVTFVYDLHPLAKPESGKTHELELLVMQTISDGRHSAFRVKIEIPKGEWVELLSTDRSQGDQEQWAYIILRLRSLESAEHSGDDAT